MSVEWNSCGSCELGAEDLLDFPDLLLRVTNGLLDLALGLETGIANHLAGEFLEITREHLGGAGGLVLRAGFHNSRTLPRPACHSHGV